jgi:hypothetical protein
MKASVVVKLSHLRKILIKRLNPAPIVQPALLSNAQAVPLTGLRVAMSGITKPLLLYQLIALLKK